MAGTLVEKAVCEKCGSGVREGSVYCFSCGESVVVEPHPAAIVRPDPGLLNRSTKRGAVETEPHVPDLPPVSVPVDKLETAAAASFPARDKELKTAAAIRQGTRVRAKKVPEVEWVERSSSPAILVIVAVAFTVVGGLLVAAAMYLK